MDEFKPLFGRELRLVEFLHHDPDIVRLNNGSFGSCPKTVQDTQRFLSIQWCRNPDDFWHSLKARFGGCSKALASRLFGSARPEDVVLVDNLTVAMAALVHSIVANITEPNAVILVTNFTYAAVVKAISYGIELASTRSSNSSNSSKIEIVTVTIPFPLLTEHHDDVIVELYRNAMNDIAAQGKHVAVAFLDHITSVPALLIPVERIIPLLREFGTKEIVVDGAHAPGMLDLSCVPSSLGADYYVGNMHKWCMAPISVAVMWISPTAPSRHNIHHPIVSHSFREGISAEFAMLGTRDYSSMLAGVAALDFIDNTFGGIAAMYARNHQLCIDAIRMLSKAWGSEAVALPESLHTSMGMVGLPAELGDTLEANERLRLELRAWKPSNINSNNSTSSTEEGVPQPHEVTGGIVVQWSYPVAGDRLYMRISAAVYNYMEEFETLRDAVLEIAARRRAGQEGSGAPM